MKNRSAAIIILIMAMAASIYSVMGCSFAVGTDYGPSGDEQYQAEPTAYRFSNPVFELYAGYNADLNAMFDAFSNAKADEPCPDYVEASIGISKHIRNSSLARLSVGSLYAVDDRYGGSVSGAVIGTGSMWRHGESYGFEFTYDDGRLIDGVLCGESLEYYLKDADGNTILSAFLERSGGRWDSYVEKGQNWSIFRVENGDFVYARGDTRFSFLEEGGKPDIDRILTKASESLLLRGGMLELG